MSDCSRRNFLKGSALLGAATVIGCNAGGSANNNADLDTRAFATPPKDAPTNILKGQIPTKILGKTGEKVPILAHGGMYDLNNVMVGRAFELGINYFDTADCYLGGQSEIILGRVLEKQGKRKESFIVSKDHPHQPSDMLRTIDTRLEKLRTDYLDLYYIHQLGDGEYPKECVNWPKSKEFREVGEQLKKQKKIRFIGFSCHAGILPQALEAAAEGGFIDVIMFRYNFRSVNSDELNKAIDKAKKANIGLVAMKTQGGRVSFKDKADAFKSKGFNDAQSALKAVWADERIDTIVSHMPTLQIVQENAMAAMQNQISEAEQKLLQEYAQATNHLVCHGCDHICSPHVPQEIRIGDTLRYLMYHDNYNEQVWARELYSQMPAQTRLAILQTDYSRAEEACPHKLEIGKMMAQAALKLGNHI
ncbi:MAG: aldo/keto reductase [Blastocatellia bacterium]|nr:aldo/keto reductase [Blastocatellia bacterium]